MAKPPAPTNDILTTGLAERIIPLEVRPVVDLATSARLNAIARLGGLENHDGRALERFAELQGRRRELLIYMVERAARHIKTWRASGFDGSLFVSLPPQLIADRTLATSFDVISKGQGIAQTAFTVLVPQAEYLRGGSDALAAMWRLRKAGCGVAMFIDIKAVSKFGRLGEHPFSAIAFGGHHAWKRLKTIGPGKLGATGSWLGWGESLGLKRIACGINDESERETARLYGFSLGEGMHFADYMSARSFMGEGTTAPASPNAEAGLPPPPVVVSLKRA